MQSKDTRVVLCPECGETIHVMQTVQLRGGRAANILVRRGRHRLSCRMATMESRPRR